MLVVVDYGMGNLGSIYNILRRVGGEPTVSSSPEVIAGASKLILPGVGAFDNGMRNLERMKILQVLHQKVTQERTPIIGICLGMQLLTCGSEEGELPGLSWVQAQTVRFRFTPEQRLKVPHMGWNSIRAVRDHSLLAELDNPRFYFVHSYYVRCESQHDVLAVSQHGHEFCAAISKDNILGTQFHPEKSHRFGMRLLENFVWRFGNAANQSDAMSAA